MTTLTTEHCPTCGTRLPQGVRNCAACARSGGLGLPLGMAAGAAVAGALLWGGLTWLTGYEIGYAAWGIGLLVGASAVWAGGRGRPLAVACAVLALASIVGGRLVCIELMRRAAANEIASAFTPEALGAGQQQLAAAVQRLGEDPSDEQIREFLVEEGDEDPDSVDDEALQTFRDEGLPTLRAMAGGAGAADFTAWRQGVADQLLAGFDHFAVLRESLSAIDLIFALLGITTAFGLVSRAYRATP
jgi:hypothetical protein